MPKLMKLTERSPDADRRLMAIYADSNQENADDYYPEEDDREIAVAKVEREFLEYLDTEFYADPRNAYYVLAVDGEWVAALRLSRLENYYFIEAIETRPDRRREGYTSMLYGMLIESEIPEADIQLRCTVARSNRASLNLHAKLGFEQELEYGIDPFSNGTYADQVTLVYQKYPRDRP